MNSCVLTIDIGTTSVKTAVFDRQLHCLCSATEEYMLLTAGGLIEMDPTAYLDTIAAACARMLREHEGIGDRVAAVVCTTQGETIIPVAESGQALANAIVWLDGRAQEQAERLAALFPPEKLYPRTGVTELTGAVPLCKVLWLKENRPDLYRRIYKVLLLEDWILLRLTGHFVTGKVVLSSTGYYNIAEDRYDDEILGAAGIPQSLFPEMVDAGTALGSILPQAAARLGISTGTTVFAGAMDQVTGALAAGNCREGIVTETTGTAMAICATSAQPRFDASQCAVIYRHAIPGKYLVINLCVTAGIILKWFLDEFCVELAAHQSPYDALDEWAEAVPAGSDGLVVLPYFTGIMTPESNPNARGALFGLELGMGKGHVARAIMESVGYMLRENLDLLRRVAHCDGNEVSCFGGASRSDLWLQIKADICGVPMRRAGHSEGASLGAAMIAALAMGWYPSYEAALGSAGQTANLFLPDTGHAAVYQTRYKQFRALYAALKPLFAGKTHDKDGRGGPIVEPQSASWEK